MPLLSFWDSNPEATDKLSIQQVVGTAGDGKLRDLSQCSEELRQYFQQVSSDKLAEYLDQCLTDSFTDSGLVLQDLVNELGRRLDFSVTNGAYQGKKGAIRNDGLWVAPEGNSLVIGYCQVNVIQTSQPIDSFTPSLSGHNLGTRHLLPFTKCPRAKLAIVNRSRQVPT